MSTDALPVLIGVGQVMEPVPDDLQHASSYAALAAQATARALQDTAAGAAVLREIDVVAAVRTFEDTLPGARRAFGGPRNLPGAVARRIRARPRQAVYAALGGHSPQQLVNEFAGKCRAGECSVAMLFGTEVTASVRAARRCGQELDWREPVPDDFEDRGGDEIRELITPEAGRHGLSSAIEFYALMETARRAELGMSREDYAVIMGELFAPFSQVAARNPYAQFPRVFSPQEIVTPGEANPMLASPYTRNLVAKDGVNQAAAVLVTAAGRAKALGVPEDRWVYLHGCADTTDLPLMQRERLGRSVALGQALAGALASAGRRAGQLRHLDLYSCFPVVVLNARDALHIADDDPRSLTKTGGLPYFGGPGNNYTMHAIASLVEALRVDPGSYGLAQGNGGFMSRHSVGVYSTAAPRAWPSGDSSAVQELVNRQPRVATTSEPNGVGRIESYVVRYLGGCPANVVVIGRLQEGGARFMAMSPPGDADLLRAFVEYDPLGGILRVTAGREGNTFSLRP